MAEGKSTIIIDGEAGGLKAASQEAVDALKSLEAQAQKTNQATNTSEPVKQPSKAFEGVLTSKIGDQNQAIGEVKEWAESVKVAGAASENAAQAAGKLGEGMAGSAAGVGVLKGALNAAASEAGGFTGVLIRLVSKIHPLAAAALAAVVGIVALAKSFLEAGRAANESSLAMNKLRIAWKEYLDEIVNPPSDLTVTFKKLDAAAEEHKKNLKDAADIETKALESARNWTVTQNGLLENSTAQLAVKEKLANDFNRIDSNTEKTKRELVKQSDKKRVDDSVAAETERIEKERKLGEDAAERKRKLAEDNLDAEKKLEIQLAEETGDKVSNLEQEWAREAVRLQNEAAVAKSVGDTATEASLNRQLELTTKIFQAKIANATQEAQDAKDEEDRLAREKAERIDKEIKDAAKKRYEAERDMDIKLHKERMDRMEELRGDRQGDLGGISFINSGRDAIWMNGGGGR